jgi:hypothetical protein
MDYPLFTDRSHENHGNFLGIFSLPRILKSMGDASSVHVGC